MRDILSVLVSTPRFGTFVRALVATLFVEDLGGRGPFRVLAPSEAAFEALTRARRDEFERLFRGDQIERLIDFVEAHVLTGPIRRAHPPLSPPIAARHFCCNGEIQVVDRLVWPWPEPEAYVPAMRRSGSSVPVERAGKRNQMAQ